MVRIIQAATLILCIEICSAKYFTVYKGYSSTENGVQFRNLFSVFPTITPFSGNLGPFSVYITTSLASFTLFWSNCYVFPCDRNMYLLVPKISFSSERQHRYQQDGGVLTLGHRLTQLWRLTILTICSQWAGFPQECCSPSSKACAPRLLLELGSWEMISK